MTPREEKATQKERDAEYIAAAEKVWGGPAKHFREGYDRIQPLYDGTSFQKKYYPKHYQEFIKTQNK